MSRRKVRIYSMMEYPGSTVEEHINLMKRLNIYSPEVENILKWHPKVCPVCDKQYFPSGSLEIRCHVCQKKYRNKYLSEKKKELYWKNPEKSRKQVRIRVKKHRENT